MLTKGKQLAQDFKQRGWQIPDVYNQLRSLMQQEAEIYDFCCEILTQNTEGTTLFHSALSYINEEHFGELITIALKKLQNQACETSESVIEYASIQLPHLLHPYLDELITLDPNGESYYADYYWRNVPSTVLAPYLAEFLQVETPKERKQKLFSCLMEARHIQTIEQMIPHALAIELSTYGSTADYIDGYLESVGLCLDKGVIKHYCSDQVYHIQFESHYLNKSTSPHLNRTDHPTWQGESTGVSFAMGGYLKEDDNNPFMHILTFGQFPSGLPITGLSQLVLGCHIRELNENGIVFYQHDEAGIPHKIGDVMEVEWTTDAAMKPTKIQLVPTADRWSYQSWGSSNSRENLFRIGGEPSWIQGGEVLTCPISGEKMHFILQLDSEIPDVAGSEVFYGSGGICYIFWCDTSKVSGYIIQHT